MKKKFVVLTLCFILIFSSLNYKKTYADGGVISAPILATVCTLAVATGVAVNSDFDLYSIGQKFYDFNKATWDTVVLAFNSSVAFNKVTNQVSVGKDFLDIFKNTFKDVDNSSIIGNYGPIPIYDSHPVFDLASFSAGAILPKQAGDFLFGDIKISIIGEHSSSNCVAFYKGDSLDKVVINPIAYPLSLYLVNKGSSYQLMSVRAYAFGNYGSSLLGEFKSDLLLYPNYKDYDDSLISDKESIGIYVPNDLGNLKGVSSGDILGPSAPPWVGNGSVSIPNVNNPSISVDDTISFPFTGSDSDVACSECGLVGTHSSTCSKVNTGNPSIGLPEFPSWGEGLDFSPITESDISDKFPFCLAKDISNLINVFDVGEKEPIFEVPFLGEVYTIDLAQFTVWADIIKFFTLLGFIFGLIKITRGIIG